MNSKGHIISLDRDSDGALRFYDPQTGVTRNLKEFTIWGVKEMKFTTKLYRETFPKPPKILRVDDKQFNLDVVNKILEGVK